jgi:hypothetical protein
MVKATKSDTAPLDIALPTPEPVEVCEKKFRPKQNFRLPPNSIHNHKLPLAESDIIMASVFGYNFKFCNDE